ncbi:hypothetical protein CJ030_MR2G005406 [Morella rubra]|uniref:NAD(P)-binding domain-containing protein n=1 Tax=Morella rubra TaxID=262757 RepID=A0A6A1W8Z2_9ROSI|nr:hypothetical protein CJ030_MR2G005406 [Morella rubra]
MATTAPLILRTSTLSLWTQHSNKHISFFPFSNPKSKSFSLLYSTKMEGAEITEEVVQQSGPNGNAKKKIFVAGATGSTGKRIVEQLLAKGFQVKAGVRDVEKAKTMLSHDNPALQIVKADVTEGSERLVDAVGDDSEAVICATGFRPGWDLFTPWKNPEASIAPS